MAALVVGVRIAPAPRSGVLQQQLEQREKQYDETARALEQRNRTRRIHLLATGGQKQGQKQSMLRRLFDGDLSIPAGRVCRELAVISADRAAAGDLAS